MPRSWGWISGTSSVLRAHPSNLLPALRKSPETLRHLEHLKSLLGVNKEDLARTNPHRLLIVLGMSPENLRNKIETFARERGVDPRDLPKIYAANALLGHILRKETKRRVSHRSTRVS